MNAGTLKDRVTIQRYTADVDPAWGATPGWTDITEVWADVTPTGGTEKSDNAGIQTSNTHRVSLRYRSDLTSKDRLVYRGRKLEIVSVLDVDGAKRELLIEAREHPQES